MIGTSIHRDRGSERRMCNASIRAGQGQSARHLPLAVRRDGRAPFHLDGCYAYISTEQEGYIGTIVMILDLKDPTRPEEVGRWWMQGQWTGGGETPGWKGRIGCD